MKQKKFLCPKCKSKMEDTLSLLAPTYETFMCFNCGGLFYELTDKKQLEEIIKSVVKKISEKTQPMLEELTKRLTEE